jgi:2'-5' RNA ligase
MPFGPNCEYADMEACIADNGDKDDPAGYCATLQEETEEACAESSSLAEGDGADGEPAAAVASGRKWRTRAGEPIAWEGVPTGDGRMIERDAIVWDDGPWPLIFDLDEGDHSGTVIGFVSRIWREAHDDGNQIHAEGEFSNTSSPDVLALIDRAAELLDEGAVGVSVHLDDESVEIRVAPEVIEAMEAEMAVLLADAGVTDVAEQGATVEFQDDAVEEEPEAAEPAEPERETDDEGRVIVAKWSVHDELYVTTHGRIRHLAIVDTAAFAKSKIANDDGADPADEPADEPLVASLPGAPPTHTGVPTWTVRHGSQYELVPTADGRYRVIPPAAERAAIALTASVRPADLDAFEDPRFGRNDRDDPRLAFQAPERPDEPPAFGAPLTVTDDGRVFGHAALWNRCHAGFNGTCVRPPRGGGYERFLSGQAIPGVATGPITVGTTHAGLRASPSQAMDHYADTGRAVADVTIGDDRHGIWVAGRLRPGAREEDIAALRGSSLSADWRPIGGQLRLVGLLAVNNPGFLIARHANQHLDLTDGLAAAITFGACDCGAGEHAALVAAATEFTGVAAVLLPSAEDQERLAQEGYEPPDAIHLTLGWFGAAEELSDDDRATLLEMAESLANDRQAFEAEAFAPAVFNPESDEAASVLIVQGEGLPPWREAFEPLDQSDHPQWIPHVTIGYNVEPGEVDMVALTGPIMFDRVAIGIGDELTVFDLQRENVQDDADDSASDGGLSLARLDARLRNVEAGLGGLMLADLERIAPSR